MPTINELINPAIATDISICRPSSMSNAISNPAPNITGIASKKEYLADSFALRPKKRAQLIVIPLLEIPGIIANAWAIPISNDL